MYKSYVPPTEFVADNTFYQIKMGATQQISSNPVSTGLMCLVWAASQTLIQQHGMSAMRELFFSVFGVGIDAMAEVFDQQGDQPMQQIRLAMVEVVIDVEHPDFAKPIHLIPCSTYRTDKPAGMTTYFALVAADEAGLFMQERQAANLPKDKLT